MGLLRRTLNSEPVSHGSGLRCSLTPPRPEETLLAAVTFDGSVARPSVQRDGVQVLLQPLLTQPTEHWLSGAPVKAAQHGSIRTWDDGEYLFGLLEVDEAAYDGIRPASEHAYIEILSFQETCEYPHLLRMWNYLPGINDGASDEERYKQFCAGRAAGLASMHAQRLPAASAIGTRAVDHVLQVYWIAAREPGITIENPRQLSAYRYPRQYGPAAPSFSRAMLSTSGQLFISGTASIVGHASLHPGDIEGQLAETVRNLDTLTSRAHEVDARVPGRLGTGSVVKVYLRHASDAELVRARLIERYGDGVQIVLLQGDICRSELLLEIECVHGGN